MRPLQAQYLPKPKLVSNRPIKKPTGASGRPAPPYQLQKPGPPPKINRHRRNPWELSWPPSRWLTTTNPEHSSNWKSRWAPAAPIQPYLASYSKHWGVPVTRVERSKLADGSIKPLDVGDAAIRLAGKEFITTVSFADEGEPSLLGVITLEQALMAVDPVNGELITR